MAKLKTGVLSLVGPAGTQRRRWAVLWAFVFVVGGGFAYIQTVLAVHQTGRFELDGNTLSGNDQIPADDWDRVCFQVTGNAGCGASSGTTGNNPFGIVPATGATAVAWTGDCLEGSAGGFGCNNPNATIFTGGGSKDPIDINQWAWKDGSGGLPDKDNLVHAFAARYVSAANASTCPSGTATNCDVIYFGSDRFDNSGDAQQGFWFLQKGVKLGTNSVGGGTGFTGVHTPGDLLVISDFAGGGGTSLISIFKWEPQCTAAGKPAAGVGGFPCADTNLLKLRDPSNANCAGITGGNDAFCGIVNDAAISTQWPTDYTNKSGGNGYLTNEFYEAGVNLSLLGLSNECFSTIVAETRSSQSTSAVLKDFVIAPFAPCGATLTTTPSAGAGGEVSPGTAVTDLATVLGTGLTSPPTPTGNVTFFLCSFAAGSTDLCNDSNAAHHGTQVGNPVALADSAPPAGEAQATSDAVNTAGSPLAPGRYCFRSEWPGDSNYFPPNPPNKFVEFGSGNSECFVVRQIPTTTVTTPSDGSGVALQSPVALGTSLFDKAVVTGTSIGGTPPGTVNFFICNPTQVTGAAGSEVCANNDGAALTGNPRTLVAVGGSNPPASSVLSSPAVSANLAGVWCFRATYVPSGTTYTGSSDATHGECVTVLPAPTTTVTNPLPGTGPFPVNQSVTDHAIVTGSAADGDPTGTVTFFICNPTQVTGAAGAEVCASGGTQVGSAVTVTHLAADAQGRPRTEATSSAVIANVVGTWCFRGVYTPGAPNGANYVTSSDATHAECFTVQDSTDITSAQTWLPNDSATLTAAGGTHLNGSLKFTLFQGAACSGTILIPTETFTLSDADPGATGLTRTTTNGTFKVSASTTVYWQVIFESTDSKVIGKTRCNEQTQLTINNATP